MTQYEEKKQEIDKLKLDIFVPLNVCACQWEQFMNLVFQEITKYTKYIKFETKNLDSEEARALNLLGNSVVIDGKEVVTSSIVLKQKLLDILKERGII